MIRNRIEQGIVALRSHLQGLQDKLSFAGWQDYPQFNHKKGLGRTAFYGVVVGIIWGFHACLFIFTSLYIYLGDTTNSIALKSDERLYMLWQWSVYSMAVAIFHFCELATTALYNPQTCTADSFLINHSTGYTAAALSSWTEFWLRFILAPKFYSKISVLSYNISNNNSTIPAVAYGSVLLLLVFAQFLRSNAMITAGQSFNHYIQIVKQDSHVLITHGVYQYWRHPSYVGFFYWTLATQLVLGNLLHATVLTLVSWQFFKRRIAYEEASLCELFPLEYPAYIERTYMGIPFIKSTSRRFVAAVKTTSAEQEKED